MAFIPNKELYIGLSGCVTALACLWANAMRKKNRNTKTRLRQELLDLREMIIGQDKKPTGVSTCPSPPVCEPAKVPQRGCSTEPRNTGRREATGDGHLSGASGLARGREMGGMSDLRMSPRKGVPKEKYVIHPTPEGVILSPINNQSYEAVQQQRERVIAQHSPNRSYAPVAGPSGMQRSASASPRCGCPAINNVQQHKASCPKKSHSRPACY